jgi:hypothetical protein
MYSDRIGRNFADFYRSRSSPEPYLALSMVLYYNRCKQSAKVYFHMKMERTSHLRPSVAGVQRPGPRGPVQAVLLVLAMFVSLQGPIQARVLNDSDLDRISNIKTSFANVVTDVVQSSRRPDLSTADSECMNSALRELMQISEELKSYEYLLTIESQLSDFGDDKAMKGILRFAVDKALDILETERKRLGQLSEQCSRSPLAAGKVQQAARFIDGTTAILKSIQPRL